MSLINISYTDFMLLAQSASNLESNKATLQKAKDLLDETESLNLYLMAAIKGAGIKSENLQMTKDVLSSLTQIKKITNKAFGVKITISENLPFLLKSKLVNKLYEINKNVDFLHDFYSFWVETLDAINSPYSEFVNIDEL